MYNTLCMVQQRTYIQFAFALQKRDERKFIAFKVGQYPVIRQVFTRVFLYFEFSFLFCC